MWSPAKMDETGKKMHRTLSMGRAGGPRAPLGGNGATDAHAEAERPAAEIIAARLRSVVVESHFAAREWRLDAGVSNGFDHCLILQSGEAWLHPKGEHLHVLGPAFVWSPANSADRLVIEAGG